MSVKTTLVLLVLLLSLAAVVKWLQRDDLPTAPEERRAFATVNLRELTEIRFVPGEARSPKVFPFRLMRSDDETWSIVAQSLENGRRLPARTDRCLSLLEVLRDATFIRRLPESTPNQPGQLGLIPTQGDVLTMITSSGSFTAVFGFDIDASGVVLRVGEDWPPCVVDKAVLTELRRPPGEWRERRMIAAEPAHVRSVALVRDGNVAARLVKESGRWLMTDPSLGRADQTHGDRLAALSVTLACGDGDSQPPTNARFMVVEVELANSTLKRRYEVAYDGPRAWLRASKETPWVPCTSEIPDLFVGSSLDLRSRRLFDCDLEDLVSVEWRRAGAARVAYRRIAGGWFYEPPDESGWTDLNGRKPALPLDRLAGARLMESIAVTDAMKLSDEGPATIEWEIAYSVSKNGSPPTSATIKIGKGPDDGLRFTASHGISGSLRKLALSAFEIPWWTVVSRQLNTTAPWSITDVEVTDAMGRSVAMRATSIGQGRFGFTLTSPEHPDGIPAPSEQLDPILGKITGLSAKRYEGLGQPQNFGLTTPRFTIRWKDTVQRNEAELTLTPQIGRWYTWRVGTDDGDGGLWGDYPDSMPGFIFATERRDIDPFIDALTPK